MRNMITGIEMIEKQDDGTMELSQATGLSIKKNLDIDKEGETYDPIDGSYKCVEKSDKPLWPSIVGEVPVEKGDGDEFEMFAPFIKVDKEKQILYAVVYEPNVKDSQGDSADAEQIELAAHQFMKECQTIKIMHKGKKRDDIDILESYVAPCDCEIGEVAVTKGTWLIVLKINDKKLWAACKSGKLTGVSMAGHARSESDAA
ncbi:MAG: XkdF-like putative serine protease domain-containing protein [Sedimentisphaerales bacterium]